MSTRVEHKSMPQFPVNLTPTKSLTAWLRERESNARRIATGRRGEEAAGWLEDAEFFRQAGNLAATHDALVEALRKIAERCHTDDHDYKVASVGDVARAALSSIDHQEPK